MEVESFDESISFFLMIKQENKDENSSNKNNLY